MEMKGKTVAVTGAGKGIGRALALAFHARGAKHVACLDIDLLASKETAQQINGLAIEVDVSAEANIVSAIDQVEDDLAPIDVFCSNAGILHLGGVEVPDITWDTMWNVNLMSHVWAARRLIPGMTARGGGTLLNVASAAGLLNQIGSAPYGVTKHAAVGLAEWLAITYGDQGINVAVLCPQGVRTDMILGHEDHVAAVDGILSPEDVAEAALVGLEQGHFMITPHASVRGYLEAKAQDYDRWVGGMRKLNRMYTGG